MSLHEIFSLVPVANIWIPDQPCQHLTWARIAVIRFYYKSIPSKGLLVQNIWVLGRTDPLPSIAKEGISPIIVQSKSQAHPSVAHHSQNRGHKR